MYNIKGCEGQSFKSRSRFKVKEYLKWNLKKLKGSVSHFHSQKFRKTYLFCESYGILKILT
jgi:hypothetical protein